MHEDDYLTVGDLKRWIKEYKLPDDTKIYVEMPCNCTAKSLKEANLSDLILKRSKWEGTQRYIRAWGPCLRLKEKKRNLYIEIYY
jgi:hypothetical protein